MKRAALSAGTDHPSRSRGAPFGVPLDKAFQRVKLGQAELVVDLGGVAVAVLGALPELAAVGAAGEHGPVLLRLMAKNGHLFPLHVVGREGNHALDLMRLPFFPGAAIEPDFSRRAVLANLPQ